VRFLEVVLPAADPEALAEFHGPAYGSSRIRFQRGPAVCSHFAVNVPPQRFEEAVAQARERVELEEADVPFPAWRARSAYFFDPGGNIVELIARERAPGEDLFLEISEVGLPVADVGAAVEWLESELGLPHFSGDRRNFSAVGDDRGLFIVVPVGRPWLFTEEPAPDVPVEVTIEGERGGELVVPGSGHVVTLASV
jgi:catechol-2,3-dioxygenase